jgi:hypothetical protein
MSSYSITFIAAERYNPIRTTALIVFLIGVAYCGHMHYIDGLFTENYSSKNKGKKKK